MITEAPSKLETSDETPQENATEQEADRQRKKDFLIIQIQNLLMNATSHTVAKLDIVSNAAKNEYSRSSVNISDTKNQPISNGDLNGPHTAAVDYLNQNELFKRGIDRFKNETMICAECYGDLFVV